MYLLSTTISQCHKKSWIIRVNVIKLSKYLPAYQLLNKSKCNQLPFFNIFPCTSIAKQKQNIFLIFKKVTKLHKMQCISIYFHKLYERPPYYIAIIPTQAINVFMIYNAPKK